ncbi:MAG: hypothetical protein HYS86_01915 [Candidatus Chisholmbacteria bacterium]|nr:hypothetical protein [Candidatus Chisholmbacteria bacterium]
MKKIGPLWLVVIILIFATVFQFLYFLITVNHLKTELVTANHRLDAVTSKMADSLAGDINQSLENQTELVEQLKAKFDQYDQDLQVVAEAIKTLQSQMAQVATALKR